ncbi:MAG: TerB family tellurite resistance protein [Bacteroidales bacterium]|nr:TerB family tellurite resistance protein [Bacteroidales bacterium]
MGKIDNIINDIERQSTLLIGERNNFMLQLMALSAYIINVDVDSGMRKYTYVCNFVNNYFGTEKAQRCHSLLGRILNEQRNYNPIMWASKIEECARDIASYTTVEERLLIVDYLILVAKADGVATPLEAMGVTNAAAWLGVAPVAEIKINQLKSEIVQ